MSQVYSTEPQISGKVVIETTHGPLSIHLWCKECPTTCRYFLQLCLDGYYDNLIFHRIVPDFLIQTGDATFRQFTNHTTNTNNIDNHHNVEMSQKQPPHENYRKQHRADQAIQRQKYELNSRIRFNHRGQVAMAMSVISSDNNNDNVDEMDTENHTREQLLVSLQPQFFITLTEASHLDGKHVCFGGIHGPTMFNALRIGQVDIVNDDETTTTSFQPRILEEAPRILRVKIQEVDLPDTLPPLVPTAEPPLLPWRIDAAISSSSSSFSNNDTTKQKLKKRGKAVKNIHLLSFGEEMNDDENEVKRGDGGSSGKSRSNSKIQSSHDVLLSNANGTKKRLVTQVDEELQRRLIDKVENDDNDDNKNSNNERNEDVVKDTSKMLQETENPAQRNAQRLVQQQLVDAAPTFVSRASASLARQADQSVIIEKDGSKDKKNSQPKKKMSLVEARKAKFAKALQAKGGKREREQDTMAKFMAFQKKIIQEQSSIGPKHAGSRIVEEQNQSEIIIYHGQILEKELGDNDNNNDWIKTKFKCKRHMDHDAKRGGDGRPTDDYEVIEERNAPTHRKLDRKKKRH